jgi:hypothetical protein
MSGTLQASPMITATELLRVNLDAFQLDDLLSHEHEALKVQAELNDYINQPARRSVDERRNVDRLFRNMRLHMAHLRDLINARRAALAWMQVAQADGAGDAEQGNRPARP